jgi:hypothetical protein
VAEADGGHVGRLKLQPSGDLLRRPAGLKPLDDVLAERVALDQLAPPQATLAGRVVRGRREVPGVRALLVEEIAPNLTSDRRAVATELLGDRGDRDLGVEPAEEGAALLEGEVAVGQAKGSFVQALAKATKSHLTMEFTRLQKEVG